ncbi:MAG: MFS transporter [Chloroflexi bacterium]|nr:MFS transporter [Chloroflexota bacterium]MDA1240746.1 MFS transporter [Chloroflexota bacterium]
MAATPAQGPSPSRLSAAVASLREHDYRILVGTQLAIGLTQPVLFFTQGWYVNTAAPEDQKVLYLGILGAGRGLAFLAYVTVGGAVADRFPRRAVLRWSQVISFVLTLMIGGVLFLPGVQSGGTGTLALMIMLFASFGLIMAQDLPARTAMVREALPERLLAGGIALFQLALSFGAIFSAPFAGWSIETFGIPTTYMLAAIGPVALLLLIRRMQSADDAADPDASRVSVLTNIRDGVRVVRQDPVVRWTVLLMWWSTVLGLSVMGVLVAAWVSDILDLGAAGWGLLGLFWNIGAITSSVYLTLVGVPKHKGAFFLWSSLVFGLGVLGFSLSRDVYLTFACNVVAGGAFMALNIASLSIVQTIVPNRLLGRVTGLLMLGNGLMQIWALAVAVVVLFVGIEVVYTGAGLAIIGMTVLVAVSQRPLRTLV